VYHTGDAAPMTTTTGTDTTPVITEEYVAEVFVPVNHQSTGVALSTARPCPATSPAILYDSNGGIVASTASTAQSGTAAYQKAAWTAPVNLKGPAKYFIGVQIDNTTARFRSHILGNFGAAKKTSQTYGTLTTLTPPTTFTTNLGPVADIY
jgi:hypothetical protein